MSYFPILYTITKRISLSNPRETETNLNNLPLVHPVPYLGPILDLFGVVELQPSRVGFQV